MTDRIHSLTVILEADTRTDDIQPLIDAILHLRGVATVRTHIANVDTAMAEARAKRRLMEKVWAVFQEEEKR